ncbi:hypothetical protein V8D89_001661 [Ganoderma adspersum]
MENTLPIGTSSFSPIVSISGAFGAVFVGAYISLSLYGLFIHQAFKYFRLYGADALWLKSLVILALVLEAAVSALHIHLTYFYFVENYGNPLAFLEDVLLMAGAMGISIGEWALNLSPAKFDAFTIHHPAITVVGFRGLSVDNFQTLLTLTMAYNAVASGGDVVLTASMIYILHNCRTGLRRTDDMINRLIMYTTHVLGINNWAWLGTMMIAERLYSNSLMAALNSRRFTAEKAGEPAHNDRRRADPFGTAVRLSTVRFDHGEGSSVTDGDFGGSQTSTAKRSDEGARGCEPDAEKEGREIV